jgi:nicotinate-nucleotide adenylyltransferase
LKSHESRVTRRVGILGGTFDPIHYGHLVIAEEVRATLQLAEVIFIPAGDPPHKQGEQITAAQHRLAMLKLALASNPHFAISLIDMDRAGPSYTVETLRLLRAQWREATEMYFIIGWDSLDDFPTWHEPGGILEQLAALVAVQRPGYSEEPAYRERLEKRVAGMAEKLLAVSAPQLEISATDLRRRIAEGRPIKYQLPEVVERYIYEHKLYQKAK